MSTTIARLAPGNGSEGPPLQAETPHVCHGTPHGAPAAEGPETARVVIQFVRSATCPGSIELGGGDADGRPGDEPGTPGSVSDASDASVGDAERDDAHSVGADAREYDEPDGSGASILQSTLSQEISDALSPPSTVTRSLWRGRSSGDFVSLSPSESKPVESMEDAGVAEEYRAGGGGEAESKSHGSLSAGGVLEVQRASDEERQFHRSRQCAATSNHPCRRAVATYTGFSLLLLGLTAFWVELVRGGAAHSQRCARADSCAAVPTSSCRQRKGRCAPRGGGRVPGVPLRGVDVVRLWCVARTGRRGGRCLPCARPPTGTCGGRGWEPLDHFVLANSIAMAVAVMAAADVAAVVRSSDQSAWVPDDDLAEESSEHMNGIVWAALWLVVLDIAAMRYFVWRWQERCCESSQSPVACLLPLVNTSCSTPGHHTRHRAPWLPPGSDMCCTCSCRAERRDAAAMRNLEELRVAQLRREEVARRFRRDLLWASVATEQP